MRSIAPLLLLVLFTEIQSLILPYDQSTICRNGKSQSPIFVNVSQTTYVAYPAFVFSAGYRESTTFQVSNHNGQTIAITPIGVTPKSLVVSGGCLTGQYTFQSAHLHWPQSEHQFLNNNYIAEAHFIHKNLVTNETAVFAYFFTLADSQSQGNDDEKNSWELILHRFTNITSVKIEDGLSSFMKGNKDRFVHYVGSLTTAPCTENVLWMIVSSAMKLSQAPFNRLLKNIVTSNYRVTQPLNGRTVRRSFPSTLWSI